MKAIILENVRSLNNVGAIIRTADGAWFDRVVCVGYTPTPPRKEISKTALGAENWVPWEYYDDIEKAIQTYQELWCEIVVMEKNEKSTSLFDLKKNLSIALIMGNELEWVSQKTQKMADHICHLPMLGQKESLNVAVAAWIGMYHFVE